MTLVNWSTNLSINVVRYDEQHKELVNLINELHEGMLNGSAHEAMGEILNRLTNYTVTHFKDEEEWMAQYNYPKYIEHKNSHEQLVEQVKVVVQKHQAGMKINKEVLLFLKDWLNMHILDEDKEYGAYLNSNSIF